MEGAQEWGGWWQKLKQRNKMMEFRVAMTYTCAHNYSTTRLRQMYPDSGSHIRSPLPNWNPQLAPVNQLWIDMIIKKQSGKADQSTLVSEQLGQQNEF